jgi:hypothetical protein
VLQAHEALQEQRGDDDECRRERRLSHHEPPPNQSRDVPSTPLAPSFSAERRSARAARLAGAMPKTSPHATVIASPKAKTVPSSPTSPARGSVAGIRVRKACIEAFAAASPQAPLNNGSEQD